MSILENALSPSWASYLDLEGDVKPWLQMQAGESPMDPSLQLILDACCEWVQDYLGRPVAPTSYTRRFDGWSGWNGAFVMLPWYPVLEVTSCVEYWGTSGPHVLEESTPEVQVEGFQMTPETGMLTRVFPGNVPRPWFPGSRNVEISWVAGFNPIPSAIKIATLEFVKHWWINSQQVSQGGEIGDYDPAPASGGMWPAAPYRVTTMIERYKTVNLG